MARRPTNRKAVAIAKDVIARLNTRAVRAVTGSYLTTVLKAPASVGDDLQKHISNMKSRTCEVCALGACLLSKAGLYDAVKLKSNDIERQFMLDGSTVIKLVIDNSPIEQLKGIFGKKQLGLIETAFEGCTFDYVKDYTDVVYFNELQTAKMFASRYATDKRRMIAIMENIIHNRGTFIPTLVKTKNRCTT